MKKTIKSIFKYIPIILGVVIFSLSLYIVNYFNSASFEQILYSFTNSKGTGIDVIINGFVHTMKYTILISAIIFFFINYRGANDFYLNIKIRSKKIKFQIFPFVFFKKHFVISSILTIVILIILAINNLGVVQYVKDQIIVSTLYEEHYVDPNSVKLEFPDKKRNLIYIFAESMESTNFSKANGGALEATYIKELEDLALDNVNFSNGKKLGGAFQTEGASWTIGAMVAHTAGIPLRTVAGPNEYRNFGKGFLPGAVSIGDILKENGYENYLMIGSSAYFGNRDDYFNSHGEYNILDYDYAKREKMIPEDYKVWWGFEDKKLFDFSKEKLTELAKKDQPFNYTLLTVNTHFVDGYTEEDCELPFDNKYANSFACSSKRINDFINWIKQQEFYENTTIVVVGDHLTMQENFYPNIDESYDRAIYNTFINAKVPDKKYKTKNRQFSTFDYYPTTLSAMGVKIEGDRLGLGTNLFSNKKTLSEKMGFDKFNEEVRKKSEYYNDNILKDSYIESLIKE